VICHAPMPSDGLMVWWLSVPGPRPRVCRIAASLKEFGAGDVILSVKRLFVVAGFGTSYRHLMHPILLEDSIA
jgi:hypothetical protein